MARVVVCSRGLGLGLDNCYLHEDTISNDFWLLPVIKLQEDDVELKS